MAGDGMPQAGGMADMLPGTGRAGAAFPGKSGIIARSAAWRKGRGGGARGRERGRDKKTRRAQGLDWSGARRGCACGRHKYGGLPGCRKRRPFSKPESYAAKRIFCKDASWQEISFRCQSVSSVADAMRRESTALGGPAGNAASGPGCGPRTKNAEAPGSFRKWHQRRGG